MRELEKDIHCPEAARPRPELRRVQLNGLSSAGEERGRGGQRGGYEVMRTEVGQMLRRVIGKHRPALKTLDCKQFARGWRIALEGNEPLEYGEETCIELSSTAQRAHGADIRTPDSPQHLRIAYYTTKLGPTHGRAASGDFPKSEAVLETRPGMQERHDEFDCVLYDLG